MVNQSEQEVFAELDRRLGDVQTEQIDPQQACGIYREAKPWLEKALPYIRRLIPKYGDTLAKAITMLMVIADAYCGPQERSEA